MKASVSQRVHALAAWFFALLLAGCTQGAGSSEPDAPAVDAATVDAGTADAETRADAPPPSADAAPIDTSTAAAPVDAQPPTGRPSAGCARGPGAPGTSNKTITVAGAQRSYLLSVPVNQRAGRPLPLVFAWHGLGGSGALARAYFGVEQAAGGRAIFVYPNARPLAAFEGRTGWDLDPQGPDVQLFDAILAEVTETACIDTTRVFSVGHSFGAYMSNRLGCSRGSVLRAIGPVAGGPPPGMCTPGEVAVWLAHGTNDPTVPFSEGESSRALWVRANGCAETTRPITPMPCVAHDGCRAPVIWCVLQARHAWPPFAGSGLWSFLAGF
jgi:poly(3-hydroxybutyrate) depolymerase